MWDLATQPRSLVMLTFGLLASAAVGRMARSKAAKAAYRPYSINTVRLVRARATLSQAKPSKTSQVQVKSLPRPKVSEADSTRRSPAIHHHSCLSPRNHIRI
jgi:hypothetical protein